MFNNLPYSIVVNGENEAVKTDFRVWLNLIVTFSKSDELKKIAALKSVFLADIVITNDNIDNIMQGVIKFLAASKSYYKSTQGEYNPLERQAKAFDYEIDRNYIYAAFLQQYKIDLYEIDLHYYKFVALFDSLTDDTVFKKITGYRVREIHKIKDKHEKEHARNLLKMFELPEDEAVIKEREQLESELMQKWGLKNGR